MNYYNPYFSGYPYVANVGSKTGLFSRLFGGINISSILSGTQKTLNIVNQTIPLVKQASPIIKNAKTMFKVMNEFKRVETPEKKENEVNTDYINSVKDTDVIQSNSNGPTFFA